jgi:hypothetical protein
MAQKKPYWIVGKDGVARPRPPLSITVTDDSGSYPCTSGYGYLSARDENGHDRLGARSFTSVDRCAEYLARQYPGVPVTFVKHTCERCNRRIKGE